MINGWNDCAKIKPKKSGEYLVGISYASAYDDIADKVTMTRGTSLATYDKKTDTWHHPFGKVELWREKYVPSSKHA